MNIMLMVITFVMYHFETIAFVNLENKCYALDSCITIPMNKHYVNNSLLQF